jgi:hypothetical protein
MTPEGDGRPARAGGVERIVVPMAKGTLIRFFVTSLAGIIVCVFILNLHVLNPTAFDAFFRVVAVIGILFCAFTGLYAARRVFDPNPGLVLDAEGIIDNSNAIGAGRIRWDEITEIRVTRAAAQRFLTVVVTDPRKFIDQGGSLRRKLTEANFRKSGSPINITARTLRISFDELVARTAEFYQRYGRRT